MQTAEVLKHYANILSYPDNQSTRMSVEELNHFFADSKNIDGVGFSHFREKFVTMDQNELEESYTKIFDINSACPLDIGFVLFGEDYKRGAFLVHLKDWYRRHNFEHGSELPDHLPYVLQALAVMDDDQEKLDFIEKILLPSLTKMEEAMKKLGEQRGPYRLIIGLLNTSLKKKYIEGKELI